MLSTDNPVDDSVPWPGVSSLPASSTYTMPVTAGANHVDNVPGSTNLFAGSGIRFYRTLFPLGPFSSITADLQMSVDNDMQVFINGNELALEGSLATSNFNNGIHHRLFVASDGTVTNGYLGGDAFDQFTNPFLDTNWNVGTNELVLAVRNLSGGDAGGFSFGMTVATDGLSTVPEPASLSLLGAGVLGLAARARRRKQSPSQDAS